MKAKIKLMGTELQNSGLIPMFEIEVIDKRTNETDYIVCSVFFRGNSLVAQRDALTDKEERSKKIANDRIEVDTDLSLAENLQALHEQVINSILESENFDLL